MCPYCKTEAKWCNNKEVYGKQYGKSYMCYWCKNCDAYVGCHENSKDALGTMAKKELRDLRQKVHSLFDPLWKGGFYPRRQAYRYLKEKMGIKNSFDCHIGKFDEEQCKKAIKILS